MTRIFSFTPRLGVFAVLAAGLLSSTSVYAGEQTRAEAAIAEASGKIEAGDKAGVGTQAPELQKQAHEALMTAQDLLSHHKKSEALSAAQHAGELADQAMVVANRHKSEADSHRRDDQRDAEARAHESAAVADTRANSAEAATAAANTRAAVAEQASATANAQADAMRNAPPVIAPPTTTTVTMTAHDDTVATPVAPVHRKHHRIIHRHGRAAPREKHDNDRHHDPSLIVRCGSPDVAAPTTATAKRQGAYYGQGQNCRIGQEGQGRH